VSSCQQWHLEPPCLLWQESCRHLASPKTLPLSDASRKPPSSGAFSEALLALQVLALPCPTSSVEVAASPSSPCAMPGASSGARRVAAAAPTQLGRRAVNRNGGKLLLRSPALVAVASRAAGGAEVSIRQGLRRWAGLRGRVGARGGGGRESKWQLSEISRCVAAFLQSLMDLFRSAAVGGNYTLTGRQCSKIERRSKARIKKPPLFSKVFSVRDLHIYQLLGLADMITQLYHVDLRH